MSVSRGIRKGIAKRIYTELMDEKYKKESMQSVSRKDRRAMARSESKYLEKSFYKYIEAKKDEPSPTPEIVDDAPEIDVDAIEASRSISPIEIEEEKSNASS